MGYINWVNLRHMNNPSVLPWTGKNVAVVPCPVLSTIIKQRCGHTGWSPEKRCTNGYRSCKQGPQGKMERIEVV